MHRPEVFGLIWALLPFIAGAPERLSGIGRVWRIADQTQTGARPFGSLVGRARLRAIPGT